MKKHIVVSNWKLYPATLDQAQTLFMLTTKAAASAPGVESIICVPYVFIPSLKAKKSRHVAVGAQNVAWEKEGAFTGEVSASMLSSLGVSHVIIGHSERRLYGHETNDMIAAKVRLALKAGMHVILCVGERIRTNDGKSLREVREELLASLKGVVRAQASRLIVAYEPLWAIGSGNPDTPESTREMAIYIRKLLHDAFGKTVAGRIPVLYGGSVSPENVGAFLREGDVDGVLVGRASVQPAKIAKIIKESNYAA